MNKKWSKCFSDICAKIDEALETFALLSAPKRVEQGDIFNSWTYKERGQRERY